MALTATIYNFDVQLADIDRGVYESLSFKAAQQPSETAEYLLSRVLAYCLEYAEGIAFSKGIAEPDVPALAVRDLTGDQVTSALDYEAYPGMAEKKLAEIEAETRSRWPVGDIAMVHRLGKLEVSEVSVAVAVSCPHRAQAFEACRYAIDRLKEIVPIWKKDIGPDGVGDWIHPIREGP